LLLTTIVVSVVDGFATPSSSPVVSTSTILSDDLLTELQTQHPNEDSLPYDYWYAGHRYLSLVNDNTNNNNNNNNDQSDESQQTRRIVIRHPHFEFKSLDDLFPHANNNNNNMMSLVFNTNERFRDELRYAIRYDMISDTTIYGTLTEEQRKHDELQLNQPIIGYWKQQQQQQQQSPPRTDLKMKRTTDVLYKYIGAKTPTGDEFIDTIGSLTRSEEPPYHWTDVVGVAATQNNRMGDKTIHAWHQDYGTLEPSNPMNRHVFFGFPPRNDYVGTGVFPHIIKLQHEQWKDDVVPTTSNRTNKPIFYRGDSIPKEYVVRPLYRPGREIVTFRDVDVLHSSPDIQYRQSIMRFG
jgi:hypothetical protein